MQLTRQQTDQSIVSHFFFIQYTAMSLSRLFLITTSLLLFSLQILASSASDYSYSSKSENYVSVQKPELLDNSKLKDQAYTPKPDYQKPQPKEENDHDSKPVYKPQPKQDHDSSPDYKPQPKKHGQDYKPQPSKENGDGSKPEGYKPQPEKPGYQSKPTVEEPVYDEPKSDEKEKLLPTCIEGLVLCKSGSKYTPIKGAVVRITCVAVDDDDDCETVYSDVTDANGYFFKILSPLKLADGLKLKECKAFLEDSPMEECKVPTDVNNGIRGALLNSYCILDHKNIKLFRVGPFFYTSESQYPNPNNGY